MGGPRRWGTAAGLGARGVPAHGAANPHREGAGGLGTGSALLLHAKATRADPIFIVYTQLSPSLFSHAKNKLATTTITKLELNFFSGKT